MTTPAPLHHVRMGPTSPTPIVLLHSAALDLTYWDQIIHRLVADHEIIAIDLPGHGMSPGGPETWAGERPLEAVAVTLDSLGLPSMHLIGLSVGGTIAQGLALRDPAQIASLTLIDTGARFSDPARTATRDRAAEVRVDGVGAAVPDLLDHWFLPETAARRPDLMSRVRQTVLRQDTHTHAALWEYIAEIDLSASIAQIARPTLILVGEHDSSSPLSTARALRDAIPRARLRVIPHAAHLSPLEQPDAVGALIDDHIVSAV